jgi:hypothetical protein
MSNKYELFNAIMADRTLNPVAKNVAAVLLITFRNNKTGLCNPSFEKIAECAGCGFRSANRAAMELKAAGWLDWHQGRRQRQHEPIPLYPEDGKQCHRGTPNYAKYDSQYAKYDRNYARMAYEPSRTFYRTSL